MIELEYLTLYTCHKSHSVIRNISGISIHPQIRSWNPNWVVIWYLSLIGDAWLSLVERCVRDAEVAGSNPVASTYYSHLFEVAFLVPATGSGAQNPGGPGDLRLVVKCDTEKAILWCIIWLFHTSLAIICNLVIINCYIGHSLMIIYENKYAKRYMNFHILQCETCQIGTKFPQKCKKVWFGRF